MSRNATLALALAFGALPLGSFACGGSDPATGAGGSGGGGPFTTAAHRAWPTLVNTGSVMSAPRFVLILPSNEDAADATTFESFAASIPTSAWYAGWSADYALGAARPTVTIAGGALTPGTVVDEPSGAAYIDAALATADPALAPDGNTFYFMFLPAGVTYIHETQATSIEGHHWALGTLGDGWGVVERNPAGASAMRALQAVASHEFAEAATDTGAGFKNVVPASGPVWKFDSWDAWEGVGTKSGYIENGDYCAGMRSFEGAFTYQPIYTNTAAAAGGDPCVPASPVAYFNVTTELDWYAADAGSTLEIPITGWTTEATDDFWIEADTASQSDGTLVFTPTVQTPRAGRLNGTAAPLLNNGEAATILVDIPGNAPTGAWLTLSLWTWQADANNVTPSGGDHSHLFVVGVHVR
jgi:hypothetical protein